MMSTDAPLLKWCMLYGALSNQSKAERLKAFDPFPVQTFVVPYNAKPVPLVNLSPLYHHSHNKAYPFLVCPFPKRRVSLRFTKPPLLMEKASDSAGASPPAQAGEFSPDTRPGRMAESDGVGGPTIKINVSYGSSLHEIHLPAQSTFGDIKKLLVHKTGLEPEEQRLFFRGIEKDDKQILQLEGVKDKSKILLLEVAASKEKKLEETRKLNEMFKASEAITGIRAEVDKLSNRVTALEVSINAGNKVSEKEFLVLTELLMSQLLKLDGIEAEGEAKLQRKAEVRRVQSLVDALDSLKTRNSKPFSHSDTAVTVTTQWETFDTGTEGSNDPSTASSSTKISQDWERFD